MALRTGVMRYSLGQGLLCAVRLYERHLKKAGALLVHHGCVSRGRREYSVVYCYGYCVSQERILLWLLRQSQQKGCVTAAMSARRE